MRHDRRSGNYIRAKATAKAYRSATASAAKAYDGHNGVTAYVVFSPLTTTGPLIRQDAAHNTIVTESKANTLPIMKMETKDNV
jgi:hypothetical protein